MRRAHGLAAMCAMAWLVAPPAHAAWTRPQTIALAHAGGAALAVDGRGDAVVAWASSRVAKRHHRSAVHVAVRAADGRLRTARVWSRGDAEVFGLSAVIDRRGRFGVAWEDWDRTGRLPSMVRAVYGSVGRRFSRAHAVSTGGHDVGPTLAVAPDGTVLMVLKTGRTRRAHELFSVAWHRAGRRFGAPRALSTAAGAPIEYQPVHAAFDARGAAYVWGSCNASVLRAPAGGRRFGRPIVLAGSVLGFSVSLDGAGGGVASWSSGRCSTGVEDGDVHGPVSASALRAGTFGEAVAVGPADARSTGTQAIALPGGEGLVVYRTASGDVPAPMGLTQVVPLSNGAFGPPQDVGSLVPRAATPAGDLVLVDDGSASRPARVVVRPAGRGGDDAAAPAAQGATVAVPASGGRAAAALWATGGLGAARFRLSVWRP